MMLGLIFLLPIFFLPTTIMPLGMAKVVLLSLGAIAVLGASLIAIFKKGEVRVPKSHMLWGALALPLVYIASSLTSASPSLSLFGYTLETGTAGFIALVSILFLTSAFVFRDRLGLIRGVSALFLSLAILTVFALVKIFSKGAWLNFDPISGIIGNPLGAWTDLSMSSGLLALLAAFALDMLPMSGLLRAFTWVFYIVSIVLLAVTNFSAAWAITLGASIVLLVYLLTVEKASALERGKSDNRQGIWAASLLAAVSLIFIWNPTFSTESISATIANLSHVNNTDVRPSLSATFSVGRQVLKANPIVGTGPNTFDKSWLLHKPQAVNSTPFWNATFPFGFGFLPTVISDTGLLGALVWILFLLLFLGLGVKAIAKNPENRADRFMVISTFMISLFLWIGSFLYQPSGAMIALAFISSGLFIGSAEAAGVIGTRTLSLTKTNLTHFISALVMIMLLVGLLAFGLVTVKKALAVFHFERALANSRAAGTTLDSIEVELMKAIAISPADPFWFVLSEVELAKANSILNDKARDPETNKSLFQESLSRSIAALQNAIAINPNYQNLIALGNLYESLVPAPLSVKGAYDNALAVYNSARGLNPMTPEIPLLLGRLELDNKKPEDARIAIAEALKLKPDYADAYFFLSQLEISQNNIKGAIASAETGVVLSPGNAGVLFELGLLKYANKDYAGAADACIRALQISPDYANAKYYLGLSLDKLGKKSDALKLFEDLLKTNPDNQAIQQVLANLRAGRDALSDAKPPLKKTAPPISGQ